MNKVRQTLPHFLMFSFYLLQIYFRITEICGHQLTARMLFRKKTKRLSGLHGVSESVLKDDVVSTWLRWMSPSDKETERPSGDRERERKQEKRLALVCEAARLHSLQSTWTIFFHSPRSRACWPWRLVLKGWPLATVAGCAALSRLDCG